MAKKTQYSADEIEVLSGLEPVKKRPAMYTHTANPTHLAQEVIDNSVDEAMGGFATQVRVTLHKDDSLTVQDNGRGMPVDKHNKEKVSGVELILTRLHAGAKFSYKAYQFAGGLHGVGVSVVNALSEQLEVWVKRDGGEHYMTFSGGTPKGPLKRLKSVPKRETGTTVKFKPDPTYFDSSRFSLGRLKHLLHAKAVLCPGLTVFFHNEQDGSTEEWHYEDGLQAYLLAASPEAIFPKPPILGEHGTSDWHLSWVITWLEEADEGLNDSYVNLVPTPQGGTHVNGLKSGWLEAVREFCDYRNLLPKGVKLTADDIADGMSFVLSLKMQDPQFAGQTKERLASREVASLVSQAIKNHASLWLHQHVADAEKLAERFIERAQARIRKGKTVVRKRATQGPQLPGKLADCISQNAAESELFLVEGDSAGGSAKQARDKSIQAVMPLRGKILNTWEVDTDQVLASQAIEDIAIAIGLQPGQSDLAGLRYQKICILADADSDGLHIATLLTALFVRHFPALVKAGHVYVAMPPLYRIDQGKETHYALDDAEKEQLIKKLEKKRKGQCHIQRFKGLGEMNPDQLRETTMHPDTRRLVQLMYPKEADAATSMFKMLLSKKCASERKQWLESKGDLADIQQTS